MATQPPSIGRVVHWYALDGSGPFAARVVGAESVYASGLCEGTLRLAVDVPGLAPDCGSVVFVQARELGDDSCTCELVDGWRWPPRIEAG